VTRLKSDDISSVASRITEYDAELQRKTGQSLSHIAARAAGQDAGQFDTKRFKVAVVPLSCGEGIIGGFSEAVAGIIAHLGVEVFVTATPDAAGLAEAVERGADIIFQADDFRFVAVNLRTGKTADNSVATGRGYVAALEAMCGGLEGKQVLLVGAGQVGRSAAMAMAARGAGLSVFDVKQNASYDLASDVYLRFGCRVTVETDLDAALYRHRIVFDASPAEGFLGIRHLTPEMRIAAPGIPLGIEPAAWAQAEVRTVHDPLQLGVATMLYEVGGSTGQGGG